MKIIITLTGISLFGCLFSFVLTSGERHQKRNTKRARKEEAYVDRWSEKKERKWNCRLQTDFCAFSA